MKKTVMLLIFLVSVSLASGQPVPGDNLEQFKESYNKQSSEVP